MIGKRTKVDHCIAIIMSDQAGYSFIFSEEELEVAIKIYKEGSHTRRYYIFRKDMLINGETDAD